MKKQFREATPREIDKIVKMSLKITLEPMLTGLTEKEQQELINGALSQAHNELAEEMLQKLSKFKTTGNKQLDSEILINETLGPLLECAREKIIKKLGGIENEQ